MKKQKKLKIEEYEIKPDSEEDYKYNMQEADKILADMLIRYHKEKKK